MAWAEASATDADAAGNGDAARGSGPSLGQHDLAALGNREPSPHLARNADRQPDARKPPHLAA